MINKKLVAAMALPSYEARIFSLEKALDKIATPDLLGAISVGDLINIWENKNISKYSSIDNCMNLFELIYSIDRSLGQQLMVLLYQYSQNLQFHSIWNGIENFLFEHPLKSTIEFLKLLLKTEREDNSIRLYQYLKNGVEASLNHN